MFDIPYQVFNSYMLCSGTKLTSTIERSSGGTTTFLLFIVILLNHAGKLKFSFVEAGTMETIGIDLDCISIVIVQDSVCTAEFIGA